MAGMNVADLPTPALVIDAEALDHNIDAMSAALPGRRLGRRRTFESKRERHGSVPGGKYG